jgi:hypothetical protein
MDSARDLLPVFHYRNWLVKKDDNNGRNDDDNNDNNNNNNNNDNNNNDNTNNDNNNNDNDDDDDDDDDNSLQSDYLAQSIAVAIASTSSLGGLHHSPGSDDRHVIQWETLIESFQEYSHMSLSTSIGRELVPSSSEQVNNDMITFFRIMNDPHEPWNPLSPSRGPLVNASAAVMYNMLCCIGSKPDAPSIYHTATSEIVTNEAFQSATSRLEGYQTSVLGAISV